MMVKVKGIDIYLTKGADVREAAREAAALSELASKWVFDGGDGEAWIRVAEESDAGWIAWFETDIEAFPYKLDLNLLNDRDPLSIARALSDRLGMDLAVPDEGSLDPGQFLVLSPGGASRAIQIEVA